MTSEIEVRSGSSVRLTTKVSGRSTASASSVPFLKTTLRPARSASLQPETRTVMLGLAMHLQMTSASFRQPSMMRSVSIVRDSAPANRARISPASLFNSSSVPASGSFKTVSLIADFCIIVLLSWMAIPSAQSYSRSGRDKSLGTVF